MFKSLRTLLSLRRLPLRVEAHLAEQPNSYTLRRVRFLRPYVIQNHFRKALFYSTSAYLFWHFTIERVEYVDDGLGSSSTTGQTLERPQPHDSYSIFIPLGLAQETPIQPFRGSDPAWLEFRKLSLDSSRISKVQHDLAGIVETAFSKHAAIRSRLGNPVKARRYWLDINYPDAPPTEYERGGLEYADGQLSWTTKPVSSWNLAKLQRVLWPEALASSLWTFYAVLLDRNIYRFKNLLSPNMANHNSLPSATAPSSQAHTSAAQSPTALQEEFSIIVPYPFKAGMGIMWDIIIAIQAFKLKLAKAWRPALKPYSRECVLVTGLVEVCGPNARAVAEVTAGYNPKTAHFERISIDIKRIQDARQRPQGGP